MWIVDDQGYALHRVVEVLLFTEPVIAQKIAVIGSKDDQRIFPATQSLELFPDAAEMIVDLLHQPLVGGPHGLPDFIAHEIGAFLLLAVGGEHGMRVIQLARIAYRRKALLERIAR